MMRRQLCLQSAAILYPVASGHGAAWFAPRRSRGTLRHTHSTNQRDVVVCWASGPCNRLHASVLAADR